MSFIFVDIELSYSITTWGDDTCLNIYIYINYLKRFQHKTQLQSFFKTPKDFHPDKNKYSKDCGIKLEIQNGQSEARL